MGLEIESVSYLAPDAHISECPERREGSGSKVIRIHGRAINKSSIYSTVNYLYRLSHAVTALTHFPVTPAVCTHTNQPLTYTSILHIHAAPALTRRRHNLRRAFLVEHTGIYLVQRHIQEESTRMRYPYIICHLADGAASDLIKNYRKF